MTREAPRPSEARLAPTAVLAIGALLICALAVAPSSAAEGGEPLDDQEIAHAIDNQLFLDSSIDAHRIDVKVSDGIALLTGQARDVLSRDRATHIAELVKGVRSVSNRIEVVPSPSRTDAQIRADVRAALARDPAADSYEVSVEVEDNVVTLEGEVESWSEKQLSARVAKGVKGVVDVDNQIAVRFETDRPDAEIAAEVERRLDWDALVDGYMVDVDVSDGRVLLTGSVGSAAEKRWAEDDAWKVSGVQSVDVSGLEVDWWAEDDDLRKQKYADREDPAIERAIEDAALRDPRVSAFGVEADVQDGWVTLRGTVDNLQASRAAEQLARNTVGVTGLTNRLKIRLSDAPEDEHIQRQVEAALAVDPTTSAYAIDVSVDDGWVTLSGTVDSHFERIEAADAAGKVTGVVAVRNRLAVADTVGVVEPYYAFPWASHPTPIRVVPETDTASDRTIRQQVANELVWSPFVDRDQVEIEVEDGHVTLSGEVDSWREYYAASDNAYEGGASAVANELEVVN